MKGSKKEKAIIVLGPPGSGKGTQAELLAERFDLFHFETSIILERNFKNATKNKYVEVEGKKYYLQEEKKRRDSGKWNSPPLVVFWVNEEIKKIALRGKGIILSGSPKTIYEAEREIPLLRKLFGRKNVTVFLLKQKLETSVWRNQHRKICELMRHPILFNKESSKLKNCPIDGSKLIRREDSNPIVVKSKYSEFTKTIKPIIAYCKKQDIDVREVNGEQAVVDVFKDILKRIK